MRNGLFILLLGCLLGVTSLRAQEQPDGSVYSRFGVGERYTFAASQAQATGGLGTAFFATGYLPLSNPATWSHQVLTRFSGTYHMQTLQIRDAQANRARVNGGSLGSFKLGIPLMRRRLGLVAAFTPYSRVAYRVVQRDSLPPTPEESAEPFSISLEGTGGLHEVVLGVGYALTPHFFVGVDLRPRFGVIEHIRRITFDDLNRFVERRQNFTTQLSGITGTLGFLWVRDRWFRQDDLFSLGLSLTLPTTLHGEQVVTLGETLNRDTLAASIKGDVTLPLSVRAGAGYRIGREWLFQVDGYYEPWQHFRSDVDLPGYTREEGHTFTAAWRIGGGAEWLPAGQDITRPYRDRVAYRVGFYAEQMYFKPLESVFIRTYAMTAGVSLPTLLQGTRIDLSAEVGTRGTTRYGLVRDLFYRLSVTLNIGELWFLRRRFG